MAIKTRTETLTLADLEAQPLNARFMKGETFRNLVKNITNDGTLTSVPLVREVEPGKFRILSGHHRVKAAMEAGIVDALCMVIDQPITRQQEVALVLSHNSLSGEDDPATLKELYNELDDPDWRWYSGLDDKTLALLDEVTTEGLSEANLDFSTVNLVFLPHEHEAAEAALVEARKRAGITSTWMANLTQYDKTLNALESTQGAYAIGNIATALGIILSVFETHIEDLQDGWVGPDGAPKTKKPVPMETCFGSRLAPGKDAALILRAMKLAKEQGDLPDDSNPWEWMSSLASTYLLSASGQVDLEHDGNNG